MEQELAHRLIALRKNLGLSQREMAHEFNVSPGALAMWESLARPIPGVMIRLIEIYEEALDDEIALKKHSLVIRQLSASWAHRLLIIFASGARTEQRNEIKQSLETSFLEFLKRELSPNKIKRSIQISIFNRIMTSVSRSRGLPMKIAQAMSYLNPTMSLEARKILEQVHNIQHPMAPTIVARVIADGLGGSPYHLFKEWNPSPFAMASIGQVYLARLHSGERVAVKVQYPEIRKSLEKDLHAFGILLNLTGFSKPEMREIVKQIQKAVSEETDYLLEARNLEEFAALFKSEDKIIIPRVHRKYSCSNVLTMDYIEGKSLDAFTSESVVERGKAIETLARFTTRSIFEFQRLNTDSNKSNFIFCGDGKVGIIDFGRVASGDVAKKSRGQKDMLISLIRKEKESFRENLLKQSLVRNLHEFDFDKFWDFFLEQQMHLHSGDFLFTQEHIVKTLNAMKTSEITKSLRFDASSVWEVALAVGMWNVFAELNAPVNYGRISLEALGDAAPSDGNPATVHWA